MKYQHEWKIPVPWGKLVLLRCGPPDGEPVLLVHGRQDSSSVFGPLLDLMPDHYNYVAIDMPGNGLSDAFPIGPKLTRFHFLAAMEFAVEHLGWDKFTFIGHSMGCEQGLFFNAIYPNRITRMILLDAGPTLMRMQVDDNAEYQRNFYDSYYDNYHRENFMRKTYTRQSALQALKRFRDLNDPQSASLLERNFHVQPDENVARNSSEARIPNEARDPNEEALLELGQAVQHTRENVEVGYLSWDNRLKHLAPQNYGNDYYFELFKSIPPTLLVAASDGAKKFPPNKKWRDGAKELLDKMATLENFNKVDVEGGHDVHFTNPERVAPHVVDFLEKKCNNKAFSKL